VCLVPVSALLLSTLRVLAQGPLTPDQADLVEAARKYAQSYSASLPDFLCMQIVRRFSDEDNEGREKQLDTLKVRVGYFGHREEYKLVELNGHPSDLEYSSLGGAISTGEFGTRLYSIFAAESRTDFKWIGWSRVRHRRVAVFGYRVARENSRYRVVSGFSNSSGDSILTAYHGEISVDPSSGAVVRVILVADIPPHFEITVCSSSTEYDYRQIAGRSYLVLVKAETRLSNSSYNTFNEIEFQEYRKFQEEVTITFKIGPC
jgi:hypothetical protein